MCAARPGEGQEHDGRRVTCRPARPNPLFEHWLRELQAQGEGQGQRQTAQALESLRRYPLPLCSGAECAILKGFGRKLCSYLDAKLAAHRSAAPAPCAPSVSPASTVVHKHMPMIKSPSPEKREKRYKPSYRSGGFAILVALARHSSENPGRPSLTKESLIDKAQPLCEESLTRPRAESRYTAWSSMTRLISKGLVSKTRSRKAEFSLTDEGSILATELLAECASRPTTNDVINSRLQNFENSQSLSHELIYKNRDPTFQTQGAGYDQNAISDIENEVIIEFTPGSFDVILLIDKQETGGASKKNDPTVTQFNKYNDLKHEYRNLKVGDFTWIAKHRNTVQELVLPYIVERKRMDDLGASIKDGRFHEQKFRLKKCGLPNVLYLIENYGSNKHVGLPVQSLMQAIANTQVQNGFKVHMTDSLTHSVRFLAMMTKRLTIEYKNKALCGRSCDSSGDYLMTFSYFNKASTKNKPLTVKETFIKLLLQLKGMSVEKALAITKVYPTPKSLTDLYKLCDKKEGETLLANLKNNNTSSNVGPSVSKSIYQLFTISNLP